ncbi:hypothetical protein JCM8097_005185 [Rhodosporidiobolus ruineniae]
MLAQHLSAALRPLQRGVAVPSRLPHLISLPSTARTSPLAIRSLHSAPPRAAYRRFGDPPRSRQPPPPPRDEPADPLQILLSRLPQQQGQQQGYSYGPRGGGRRGFTLNNARAVLRSPVVIIALAGGGTYYVLHLEKIPETGRYRFMDVSPAMEKQMGEQAHQEVLSEYGRKILPDSHPQARYVQGIVKQLVRANGLEGALGGEGFKTHVVKEDETKNAFVLPNGAIFVFTGILPVAQDADGLAVVLGHEIAHQVLRHSAERMSGTKVFYGLALLLSTFGLDFGISQVLLQLVMNLPNSRKNETEADLVGLRLANTACFDPRAGESLWQRMGAAEEAPGVDMSFLSTHPSSANRTVKVRQWAEEVIKDRPDQCGPLREHVGGFQRAVGRGW